jgi:hypothetical protein
MIDFSHRAHEAASLKRPPRPFIICMVNGGAGNSAPAAGDPRARPNAFRYVAVGTTGSQYSETDGQPLDSIGGEGRTSLYFLNAPKPAQCNSTVLGQLFWVDRPIGENR